MYRTLNHRQSSKTEVLKYLQLRICGPYYIVSGLESTTEGRSSLIDLLGCVRVTLSMALKRLSDIKQNGWKRVGRRDVAG